MVSNLTRLVLLNIHRVYPKGEQKKAQSTLRQSVGSKKLLTVAQHS
ncbi:hypothetical protein PMAG_a1569 [Pseudoalteromonas mariniglutinosa NCIMB 1770]|nr:hypothetical protein [Pseudoalteromonas mariniglutinosa NCIMB 1770]